jgi:hypothetical protein
MDFAAPVAQSQDVDPLQTQTRMFPNKLEVSGLFILYCFITFFLLVFLGSGCWYCLWICVVMIVVAILTTIIVVVLDAIYLSGLALIVFMAGLFIGVVTLRQDSLDTFTIDFDSHFMQIQKERNCFYRIICYRMPAVVTETYNLEEITTLTCQQECCRTVIVGTKLGNVITFSRSLSFPQATQICDAVNRYLFFRNPATLLKTFAASGMMPAASVAPLLQRAELIRQPISMLLPPEPTDATVRISPETLPDNPAATEIFSSLAAMSSESAAPFPSVIT